jgi:Uma2 family endonuclease
LASALVRRVELVGGGRFTRPERTPFLRAIVDRADREITVAMRALVRRAHVLRDADVLLSMQSVVIPDLAIYRGPTWDVPDLIIEYRAESTDRLFFGPKRLAYARSRIPEVWFVDVAKATVTALRLDASLDYPWPAETYGPAATIASSAVPGLVIAADALLRSASAPP